MNRVIDERFPDSICEVVTQGEHYTWNPDIPIKNKCQFSWYCDGKSDEPKDMDAWEKARLIALGTYKSGVYDLVEGSTHYHAVYVLPDWHASKQYIMRIDDHIFYRWESE